MEEKYFDAKDTVRILRAVRNPLSYATLALLLIASLAYWADKALISLVILSVYTVIILLILLGSKEPDEKGPAMWYPDVHAVLPQMTAILKESFDSEVPTSIEVLGITVSHMWEYVRGLINDKSVKGLSVQFAIMAGTEQQVNCLQTNWHEMAAAFRKEIGNYVRRHAADLGRRDITVDVHEYDHVPMFNGILINKKHLFFSFCSWHAEGHMERAVTFYCYYTSDTKVGRSYIRMFRGWLDHVAEKHPACAFCLGNAERSAPPDRGEADGS